jgi:hypothetical protein
MNILLTMHTQFFFIVKQLWNLILHLLQKLSYMIVKEVRQIFLHFLHKKHYLYFKTSENGKYEHFRLKHFSSLLLS